MKIAAIIPARMASTRLPGKPLLRRTGKYLVEHVVDRVSQAGGLDIVTVATDHADIIAACESFGCKAVMTREDHASGTDRIAEAAVALGLDGDDIVINIQGDEPDIPPACVEKLAELVRDGDAPMATLATPMKAESGDGCNEDTAQNPNRVKVVVNAAGNAMYFSRAAIPFDRDADSPQRLLHLGAYAYRVDFLLKFAAMAQTPCEMAEKLEQLRALENGYEIAVAVVEYDGAGIDTPADYEAFVKRFSQE